MAQSSHSTPALNQFQVSDNMKRFIWSAVFIGTISFVVGFAMDRARIWQSLLTSFFYFMTLSLGAVFFIALQHVTKSGWSVTVRRVAESFTAFFPYLIVTGLAICFLGGSSLYEWLDPEAMAHNHILAKKQSYLNLGFFGVRTVLFFGLWYLFSKKIVGDSLKQDANGDERFTQSCLGWSIGFLPVFAISYSLFSVDYIMSISPEWYSTIFGVYCFAGLFQAILAFSILIVVYLMKKNILNTFVNENHLHDLGKLLLAFTIFYAYIAFSQAMLIWYANIPEEAVFFLNRAQGGWLWVSIAIPIFKFVVPFFGLMRRSSKRNVPVLVGYCFMILAAQYMDDYWLVYPKFYPKGPVFSFQEIGIFLGFLGLFMFSVTRFLTKNNAVAIKDPRMHEALAHHI